MVRMAKGEIRNWAVIGAGNGGQAIAGYLGLKGASVRIFDIFAERIDELKKMRGIKVDGDVDGFGKIELATTNISEVLQGTQVIMVVTPAIAHKDVAKACVPYLRDGQIVVLNPGATGGAIEFRQITEKERCKANVTIAEAQTLIFTCRSERPGQSRILATKKQVKLAALPAKKTADVVTVLNTVFSKFEPAINVLETSLNNTNAIVHPTPTLFNVVRIDTKTDFLHYRDGITPTISAFLEELDLERVNVGKALGLSLESTREWYNNVYGTDGLTLYEAIQNNNAYRHILGPNDLKTRYLYEDIPTGLVPIVSIGKMLEVPVSRMETIIKLAEYLVDKNLTENSRTVESLGLFGMTPQQIWEFAA